MNDLISKLKTKLDQASISYELISLPEDLPLDVESHMKFHGKDMKYAMPNMVFKTEKGLIVAQRRADTQIDNKKLRELLGVQRLALAAKEDLETLGLQPGIVPPTGFNLPTYIDRKVLENSEIYTGTGDKLFSLKVNPADLVKINNTIVADFTTFAETSGGKKRVFSGIQPSGNLHLGNYLGAIKRWVDSQDEAENIFCIVDLHAITVPQNPEELKRKIRELAGIYFAAGIDPEKSTVFVQSDISAHAELGWILNCFTPVGWMNRMTQFKDKAGDQKESVSMGLFDYPVLMASDILLYNTDEVPVGEDQKQHVEITRDIAQKFNSVYGETLKLPKPVIPQSAARIMSLDDPTKKMSKSLPAGSLNLLDSPDEIRSKIMKATTDSENSVKFDQSRPGIFNLLEIYQTLTGQTKVEIEAKFANSGYGDFKKELAEIVVEALKPIQEKYAQFTQNPEKLEQMLKSGADKIRPIANETLQKVKDRVGLGS